MLAPRPRDVPTLRDGLLELWAGPVGMSIAEAERRKMGAQIDPVGYVVAEMAVLRQAELYWTSADMGRMLHHAAETLPDAILREEDVLTRYGLVVFEEPLQGIDAEVKTNDLLRISALEWAVVKFHHEFWGLHMAFYDSGARLGIPIPLVFLGASSWVFGRSTQEFGEGEPVGDEQFRLSVAEDRRLMHAFFLLVSQEAAEVTTHVPDRATARRFTRRNQEVPTVRLVDVRAPRRHSESDGHRDVDWSHRWVVSGHWRNQWHPSEGRHVPRYILPYVKGPEDRPLVVKETVHRLR